MRSVIDSLRIALRDLRHRPTFAATVVLTLALGIGATTAAFALVDALFFTQLPVRDQDRLVEMWAANPARNWVQNAPLAVVPRVGGDPVPWDAQRLLAQHHGAFEDVAAFRSTEPYPFAARDGNRTLHFAVTATSGNFFDVLGVRPVIGRLLHADDDRVGSAELVVLSDHVWHRDFGADPRVIGHLVFFAGGSYRVTGIAPPEFSSPAGTDAWVAVVPELHRMGVSPDDYPFYLIGRLRRGATRESARAELEVVLRADSAARAREQLSTTGVVERYTDVVLGGNIRPGVVILFGAVLLVLVIVCTNIAGLLVSRGISRVPELALRSALGASRYRLALHLLTESCVLGVAGGALGLIVAAELVRASIAFAPSGLPMIANAHLDPRVVAFAVAITFGAVISFGLVPAIRQARTEPHEALRSGSRSITAGRFTGLARRTLVAAQIALALVVLSGAGLLARTLSDLQRVSLGFDAMHLLFFRPDRILPWSSDSESIRRWTAFIDHLEQNPNEPGLERLTTSLALPFGGAVPSAPYSTEEQTSAAGGRGRAVHFDYALGDYFGVMGIPLLQGRTFARNDNSSSARVVAVSQSFADQAWPGQIAIGKHIQFGNDPDHRWWTVIAVVGDTRYDDLTAPPLPMVYLTPREASPGDPWYLVRTRGHPARAVGAVEHAIEAIDPAFGISESVTGPELRNARLARPRAMAAVFGGLSATALLLAAVGLFGVLSAFVRDRRREMAIRSALGGTTAQLRALVVIQTISVGGLGIALGLPLALGGARVLRLAVSEVRPINLVTMAAVVVVLFVVVAVATYGPMVRAARVDVRSALAAD